MSGIPCHMGDPPMASVDQGLGGGESALVISFDDTQVARRGSTQFNRTSGISSSPGGKVTC